MVLASSGIEHRSLTLQHFMHYTNLLKRAVSHAPEEGEMPGTSHNPTRRSVLGLAAAGIASNLQKIAQAAAPADRTLVCIYLVGGSDGNNLIVPLESSQYQAYAKLRGSLALPSGDLLPVQASHNSGSYGFHPALSELRDLYNQGALAVVANVGTPAGQDRQPGYDYSSMSFVPGGYFTLDFARARTGLKITDKDRVLTTDRGISMAPLDGNGSASTYQEITREAKTIRFRTEFPSAGVGNTLKDVAALMRAARGQGIRNPLFTVPMGGFDTFGSSLEKQASLFRQLSTGMAALYSAAEEAGLAANLTVFTDSEFGRTIAPNSNNGMGRGWGNHHLVMGGSVLGHDIYGVFPDMATAARDANGGWVPTTSRDQYLSTLANWAGVPYSDLRGVFPRLRGTANLGFMA
jgi:uncharacterized protein (DUF1501 family)